MAKKAKKAAKKGKAKPKKAVKKSAPKRVAPKKAAAADWRRETLARVRALIKEADPAATEKAKWKPGERQIMARANRYHLTRTGLINAMFVMLLLGVVALKRWNDGRQLERDATNLVN